MVTNVIVAHKNYYGKQRHTSVDIKCETQNTVYKKNIGKFTLLLHWELKQKYMK